MAFALPTLGDLVERSRRAFRVHLPGSDAWIWPNNVGPTAKVLGGLTHEVFGFADYIAKSRFALTAPDIDSLELHGEEFGVYRKAATSSAGAIEIVATTALTVAAGAIFVRADGIEYRATLGGALPAPGVLTIDAVSVNNGKTTTARPGTPLAAASGVEGATSAIAVGARGFTGGADLEDIERFRSRILFRKRNPPHGGAPADYVIWATERPGVTRVFVERRWSGPGTLRLFFLMDDDRPDGIPTLDDVEAMQAHIDALAPAGAVVSVQAPVPVPVDLTLTGLAPDTPAVREAVAAEIADAFLRRGRVAGADTPVPSLPFLATPYSFSRSWAWQAAANAAGEERHALTAPAADVALLAGQMPVFRTVSFA